MQNNTLIAKLKEGDKGVYKTIFDNYYRPLCLYLRTFTPDMDSAQELAQTVFVDFWNKRENINVTSSIKSYLFKMGYNLFLMDMRKNNRQPSLLEDLKMQVLEEEEEQSQDQVKEVSERLWKIIKTLPPRCQEILQMKMHGHKYQEIALELNISIKTVESQMRIAYIKIREGFDDSLFFMLLFQKF